MNSTLKNPTENPLLTLDIKAQRRVELALALSVILHSFMAGIILAPQLPKESTAVEVAIIETPPQVLPITPPQPKIIPTQSAPAAKVKAKARSVFGVSKNSVTDSNDPNSPEAKVGNTLSKAPDNLQMKPGEENLPAPAEEFQVSTWPQLQNDVRIPYPREAKQKGIEGPVVMDLYIAEDGRVKRATLVSGPGYGLNEAALEAARQFIFSPGRVGRGAVPVVIRYTYRFSIQK